MHNILRMLKMIYKKKNCFFKLLIYSGVSTTFYYISDSTFND